MRLPSGKRLGQSGYELTLAVFLSFFLHAGILFSTLFLYFTLTPKPLPPLFYEVKLVGTPAEPEQAPALAQAGTPAPPQQEPKPAVKKTKQKMKKAPPRAKLPASKKNAPPDYSPVKQSAAPVEQQKSAPTATAAPVAQQGSAVGAAGVSGKREGVAVTTPQQDFKFSWYLSSVGEKIRRNWQPPPDAREARARVTFKVNRSGWVGEVSLDDENSRGSFGFKQAAVRAIRMANPLPPLPDEFPKASLVFSVDLMENE